MRDIDEMVPSKSNFLTKEDVGEQGKNLTIARFDQQEVGFDSDKEIKWVIVWQQGDFKPMVLNKENASRLKMICKTNDADQMLGKTVNVYNDPFVKFAGKLTGGLRIRPPEHAEHQNQQRPQPAQQPAQQQNPDWQPTPPPEAYTDDVPY